MNELFNMISTFYLLDLNYLLVDRAHVYNVLSFGGFVSGNVQMCISYLCHDCDMTHAHAHNFMELAQYLGIAIVAIFSNYRSIFNLILSNAQSKSI